MAYDDRQDATWDHTADDEPDWSNGSVPLGWDDWQSDDIGMSWFDRLLRAIAGLLGLALWVAWVTATIYFLVQLVIPTALQAFGSLVEAIRDGDLGTVLVIVILLAVMGVFGGGLWGCLTLVAEALVQRSGFFDGEGLVKRVFGCTWWESDRPRVYRDTPTTSSRYGPYQEYLQSDAWRQKRAFMLRRAGGCCQLCNAKGPLQVHHRTYERIFRERPEDLIVLCRACHARHHGTELIA